MKVHLACGRKILPDYINVDMLDLGQEVVSDVFDYLKRQKFCTIDEIRAEHFIEHLNYAEVKIFLNLCWTKLKKDGTLYIVCPHKDNEKAYVLSHRTFYTKYTFEYLGNKEFCEDYGYKLWNIQELVVNNRPDIHVWMKPNK